MFISKHFPTIALKNSKDRLIGLTTTQKKFEIHNLTAEHLDWVEQAAGLLVVGFQEWNAWPDIEDARKEVMEALEPEKICRIAVNQEGQVVGWIGGISDYNGNAWELHPLVAVD